MLVIDEGIVIICELQRYKAYSPIETTDSGIIKESAKNFAFAKDTLLIVVIPSGI